MLKEDIIVEGVQGLGTESEPTYEPDYETERNKPMPNRIHGTIQAELVFLLKLIYGDKYNFSSEVTLATQPSSTTPDVCIFPKKELDWETTAAKEEEAPITTVEIISPSQSLTDMAKKIWKFYFPMGVQSAWIVVPPPFKAIYVFTPDGKKNYFDAGTLTDPATGIQIEIEKVFAGMK